MGLSCLVLVALAQNPSMSSPLSTTGTPGVRRSSGGVSYALDGGAANTFAFYGGFNGGVITEFQALDLSTLAWSPLPTTGGHPAGRERHALGFDPELPAIVLVGGDRGLFSTVDEINVFDFRTNTWVKPALSSPKPGNRADALIAWVPHLHQFLYFGGTDSILGGARFNDLWLLDVGDGGTASWSWVDAGTPRPSGRQSPCGAYDPVTRRLVIFGGDVGSALADTWIFDFNTGGWAQQTTGLGTPPTGRGFCPGALIPAQRKIWIYGGQLTGGSAANGLASYDLISGQWATFSPAPNPALSDSAMGFAGTWAGLVLFGGRSGGSSYTNNTHRITFNDPPIVDAGPDFSVGEAQAVMLSGSATDPEMDAFTVLWTGPLTLMNPSTFTPTFNAPTVTAATQYTFRLTATDPTSSSFDTVVVTVNDTINEPPTADAGPDFSAVEGSIAFLFGAGSDPNSEPLTYAWSAVPAVSLSNGNMPTAGFVVPSGTQITVTLTVTDTRGGMGSDSAIVTILPLDAGVPDAGPPDAGPPDAGPPDAGPPDAGPPDAGPPDAGPPDAGVEDAGFDAGVEDAGFDAGEPFVDAGPPPIVDAGPPPPDTTKLVDRCGCGQSSDAVIALAAAALMLSAKTRRRPVRAPASPRRSRAP